MNKRKRKSSHETFFVAFFDVFFTWLSHETNLSAAKLPLDQGAPRLGGSVAVRSLEPKAKDIEIGIRRRD